ncbi:MAG: hypothetical protein Q7U57_00135 [Methylovulum sp.]|nr:hypothetical protein [Methylovulum sp.]
MNEETTQSEPTAPGAQGEGALAMRRYLAVLAYLLAKVPEPNRAAVYEFVYDFIHGRKFLRSGAQVALPFEANSFAPNDLPSELAYDLLVALRRDEINGFILNFKVRAL